MPNKQPKKQGNKPRKNGPVSLYPLSFDEALAGLLRTPPLPKPPKRTPAPKKAKPSPEPK